LVEVLQSKQDKDEGIPRDGNDGTSFAIPYPSLDKKSISISIPIGEWLYTPTRIHTNFLTVSV